MIEEIVLLKQKITALLQENYHLRQTVAANNVAAETEFFELINDYLLTYDAASPEEQVKIVNALKKYNVIKIPMAMAHEDNEMVKIVSTIENTSKRNGIITSFIKEGFVCGEKVVRPAEVIVVKNKE